MISSRAKEIIIGTIMGDGHLARLKTGVRLEVGHSDKQKDYVFWKYNELSELTGADPHTLEIADQRFHRRYRQWRFKSLIHPYLTELHNRFYFQKKKIIPQDIFSLLKSPLSLAVWFMDDGGRRNDSYGLFLNTLSFTKDEHQLLTRVLKENFALDSRIHWIQDGYRLYIPSSSAKHFCELVYPYLIPSMHYKLSFNPVTTSFARLTRARDVRKAHKTLVSLKEKGTKV